MAKESFTRRYESALINEVRKVKQKTGIKHTTFIEQAIEEKLLRDGHIDKSILRYEVNEA